MTTGWSLFVIVADDRQHRRPASGCCAGRRSRSSASEKIGGGADTGHVWDEDLREYNNPLPRWWLWLFYITVRVRLLYLVAVSRVSATSPASRAGPRRASTSRESGASKREAAACSAPFAAMSVAAARGRPAGDVDGAQPVPEQLRAVPRLRRRRRQGFPNLTDAELAVGRRCRTPCVATITGGRIGAMPPWGRCIGAQGVDEVVAYVQTLSGQQADASAGGGRQGALRDLCAACHGVDGKGNPLLGAPNLTDEIWLYGGDAATIKQTVDERPQRPDAGVGRHARRTARQAAGRLRRRSWPAGS